MRFFSFHYLDMMSEKTWSNIPNTVIRTLRSKGHEVIVPPPIHPKPFLSARIKYAVHRRFFNKIFQQSRDPLSQRKRAKIAQRYAKQAEPYDAVLTFLLPEVAYFKTTRPIIAVQDAAFESLVDYYDAYKNGELAPESIRNGIKLDKLGLERTSHVVYSSEWGVKGAIEHYGYPAEKMSIAGFGASIDSPPTRAEVVSLIASRAGNICRFLFIGKEWQRKGGPLAVAIVQELATRGLAVELNIVGCTPAGPFPSFVKVHGALWKTQPNDAKKLRTLFEQCDFFLTPSEAEAYGIVFCEAAVFGMPVIALDTGGVPSVVRNSWGLLLPSGSRVQSFADWIAAVWSDRAKYAEMALAARQDFEERLNWDAHVDHIIEVAQRLQPTGARQRNREIFEELPLTG